MTFARVTTVGGTITGHIERRGWWWLHIREHDGDLCEVAMRHVVSIETGGAIEAAYNRAVERAERAMAGRVRRWVRRNWKNFCVRRRLGMTDVREMAAEDVAAWLENMAIDPGFKYRAKAAAVRALIAERSGLKRECVEVEQALGRALGYPWYKDDQKNFPGATETDGVCVGEHVSASIAAEAATKIGSLIAERDALREALADLVRAHDAQSLHGTVGDILWSAARTALERKP